MALTKEQEAVVNTVLSIDSDNKIISVDSVAGSGKTATALAVVDALQPSNGFYTAFNTGIVSEGQTKFKPYNIEAKTLHSLAYKYVRPKHGIEELNYNNIKENIPYTDKRIVIDTLDDFFRSAYVNIYEYLDDTFEEEYLQDIIVDYATRMMEDKIPVTFNFMLKCVHILLDSGELDIDYDLVLLDECQDTTAVTLEIFKLINAKKKVMLGDTHQNIYSYLNTVNGFEVLKDTIPLRLTKSFRCNNTIANIVEDFGQLYLNDNFMFTSGNSNKIPTNASISYISRTNASLISRMYDLHHQGQRFKLLRPVKEIFALPLALSNANSGNPVYDARYKFLEREYVKWKGLQAKGKLFTSFYDYLIDTTEDVAIENTINMLRNFSEKRINILSLKKSIEEMRPDPRIVLSTAHAFKGLETDIVYIEKDLNNSVNKVINVIKDLEYKIEFLDQDVTFLQKYLTKEQRETLNVYYVALSRAKFEIHNVDYLR